MVLIYKTVNLIFQLAYMGLMARVLLSWIPHDRYHPVIQYLYRFTEPLLAPFRNLVPTEQFGIDLSPLFAFLALGLAKRLIFMLL